MCAGRMNVRGVVCAVRVLCVVLCVGLCVVFRVLCAGPYFVRFVFSSMRSLVANEGTAPVQWKICRYLSRRATMRSMKSVIL